jgi:putative pyruvate formate lyase activating enzyme
MKSLENKQNKCTACPIACNVDKTLKKGFCKAPNFLKINTYQLHYGEEPPLAGSKGSGTIFFSHCNMRCCYCQNYKISDQGAGSRYTEDEFIMMARSLQEKGALNINLVSPTPYTSQLIPALEKLKKDNFPIPIVWNSNAYETVETLKKLEGLVDIYLPDYRYWDNAVAFLYSGVKHYKEIAQAAIKEMYRQTGDLIVDEDGVAIYGTLVRLLFLPENANKVDKMLHWLSETFNSRIHISLLSQYYPTHNAKDYDRLQRGITKEEYDHAVNLLLELGFENYFIQEPATTPEWTPTFNE